MAGAGAGAGHGQKDEQARAHLLSSITLRFRTEREVRDSLAEAGFAVECIYGGWDKQPVGAGDGELLVLARA